MRAPRGTGPGSEERERALEALLRRVDLAQPHLDLSEIEQQLGIVGRDLERLAQEGRRLGERGDRPRVAGGASELPDGPLVAAGEAQVARRLGRATRGDRGCTALERSGERFV